ncbi:unnamed protein product [Meloidogyne enterolobii]|uniref:Uncharacterized protein n=1 Tax=Meloidogyne enterolobii TaxID=390850 RepID=A0ACB0YTE9_MELEN
MVLVGVNERFLLPLPTFIRNINDFKIVYYYLNKLFKCSFEDGDITQFIFNPKLIELLFDNAKRFYIQDCTLLITDYNIENIFHFILNHLASATLEISFFVEKDIKKYINMLFKISLNGGENFKKVNLIFDNFAENLDIVINATLFYEYILEYIATSRDYSKIVPVINLHYNNSSNLELSKRAEKVEIKQIYGTKYTKFQIVNIHNSNVKFSFFNQERENFPNVDVRIKIMKE